jgi:trk system potassium uptake protein TrkH
MARDREARLAGFAVVVLPTLLFMRHWIGALEVETVANFGDAVQALWGSAFTVLSFVTTTGFVSDSWVAAQTWSGLQTPGLLLVGLVLMGGGVATTAGGMKLLRVYALYKHGVREMAKLIYPHSVGGAGRLGRRIRREGAYIAWIFFMLFILSLAAVMLALAATGLGFEEALILSVAALSTTGPLAEVAGEAPISYIALSDPAKLILAAAMIIGRIETLVLIALLNPAFWRS